MEHLSHYFGCDFAIENVFHFSNMVVAIAGGRRASRLTMESPLESSGSLRLLGVLRLPGGSAPAPIYKTKIPWEM